MGMCWCNELLIRSARCLTTQNCWASVWGAYSRVRVTVPEPFPACLAQPRYPSMPWRAPLSQQALATSPSRHAPGPLLNYYFVYVLLPTVFSYSFSFSPVLLPKIPWSKCYIWGRCAFKEKETSSHPASKINLTNTHGQVWFDIAQKYFFSQVIHIPILHSPPLFWLLLIRESIMKTYKLMEGRGWNLSALLPVNKLELL